MCGLIGGNLLDETTATQALRLLDHRGRDASRLTYRDGVWLGHNRLAIQDLSSASNQPYERDGSTLVYNGELWRRTLDGWGYTSDTALLAELYRQYGDDPAAFAGILDGMFAVAVHDWARRRIVLVRDRMGRIPLYYYLTARGIAFASEAKALTAPLGVGFAGSGPSARGVSDVKLFPPGVVAVYDLRTRRLSSRVFASLAQHHRSVGNGVPEEDRGEAYYADGIRKRLEIAVANELVSDVPVCTILSGGVDSTIITAILARIVPDLRAYTVSVWGTDGRDDLHHARRAAAALGVPLTEVVISYDDVMRGLVESVWAVEDDRWVQVAPAVPQIALARRIGGDGYKVVFGGEGSDELFGSYGDVRRWSWEPQQYHDRRVQLCEQIGDNNLVRGNKAMMWGGTVELRTPFLDREVVDFCLRIPTRYRSDRDGRGSVLKPLLREAFRGCIPDDLLMRRKETFQDGCHSAWLGDYDDIIRGVFADLFNPPRTAPSRAFRLR